MTQSQARSIRHCRKNLTTVKFVSGPIDEFIGVYDADSTVVGEVAYWIGARFGTRHCSLCELTHGTFTTKRQWRDCSQSLAVPFRTFHRNDAPQDVLTVTGDCFPIVLARIEGLLSVVIDSEALGSFAGDTTRFITHLELLIEQ